MYLGIIPGKFIAKMEYFWELNCTRINVNIKSDNQI